MASVDIRNHSCDNIIIHGRPWTSVIIRVIILSSMASVDIRNHSCDNIIKNPHDHIITPKTSHSDRTLPLSSPTHGYKKTVDKPVHNLWKSYETGSGKPVYTVVYKERS